MDMRVTGLPVVRTWSDPRDDMHPTQMLLKAETVRTQCAAVRATRFGLTSYFVQKAVRELGSVGLHRLVDLLVVTKVDDAGDEVYRHQDPYQALREAKAHEDATDRFMLTHQPCQQKGRVPC